MVSAVIQRLGIKELNAMQVQVVDSKCAELILHAPTGSGKTLAFLLKLLSVTEENERSLVLTPTRELAQQVADVFRKAGFAAETALICGGHERKSERLRLAEAWRFLIATPGRLKDHAEHGIIDLGSFKALVIDEYDKLLEMGFEQEIHFFYKHLLSIKVHLVCSATELSSSELIDFSTFEKISFDHVIPSRVKYFSLNVDGHDRMATLVSYLLQCKEKTIVFCAHREAVERICFQVKALGVSVDYYHGGLEQDEREIALTRFRLSTVQCLIATDVAGRGLDIDDIEGVVHYQYPIDEATFIHRNGRVGRQGREGKVLFFSGDEEKTPAYVETLEASPVVLSDMENEGREFQLNFAYRLGGGKKDKLRKMDIIGSLVHELGIDFSSINGVSIFPTFTFIAIDKQLERNFSEKVKVKGRLFRFGVFR